MGQQLAARYKAMFLTQVAATLRVRGMSYQTEKACVEWVRRFILFHKKRHPAEMGAPEIETHNNGDSLPCDI